MKNIFQLLMLLLTLALVACDKVKVTTEQDLRHHRFILIKFNHQNVPLTDLAYIEFGESKTLNGKMCNDYWGYYSYHDDMIDSQKLNMTDQICLDSPLLNRLDVVINSLLQNGAKTKLYKDNNSTFLQLKDDENELTFELRDLI